ncbi:MAG: PAS domain-containing protein [Prochlorothrix sp.]
MDALQAAVAKTEAIVNTAADAILTFRDGDLQILSANPSAAHIFGQPVETLCNLKLSDLIAGETVKKLGATALAIAPQPKPTRLRIRRSPSLNPLLLAMSSKVASTMARSFPWKAVWPMPPWAIGPLLRAFSGIFPSANGLKAKCKA